MSAWTGKVKFQYDDDANDRVLYIEATIEGYTDHNYGADADGHRGVSRDFVDDVIIDRVYTVNGRHKEDIEPTSLPVELYDKLMEEAGEQEFEFDEPPGCCADCDDCDTPIC